MDSLNEVTLLETEQLSSVNVDKSKESNFFKGLEIYLNGMFLWRIWLYMAATDVRRRYRRTIMGPFWVTLSIAIHIGSIGIIFPILWHTDTATYLPFFSSGYIIWLFVSTVATEACGTYTDSLSMLKQTSLPYSVYANNVVTRNVIVLMHHLVVYVIVVIMFSVPITWKTLLFFPGIFILCLTSSWLCILLGLIATRYRDIRQLVTSFLQVAMFITPIFWSSAQLGTGIKARLLVGLNPLHHFIQIIRAPLLGQSPTVTDWIVTLVICFMGWILTLCILGKYRKHLVFWL